MPLIQKAIKIYADQNDELVYHGFKIIYKRFKRFRTEVDLAHVGEAEMCFLNIFLFALKAK